ncbi:MFS transporter [Streptomyces hygroscopicus]|uniref:MFS transporter n=1 Tax=Streptomyces hygroscopicus TaxID=1912 RepID=UPI0037AF18AB
MIAVNIAFPAIGADFRSASTAELSWVLNAYTIVLAALLVPAGRLADAIGGRRSFLTGIALFGLASVPAGPLPISARSSRRAWCRARRRPSWCPPPSRSPCPPSRSANGPRPSASGRR